MANNSNKYEKLFRGVCVIFTLCKKAMRSARKMSAIRENYKFSHNKYCGHPENIQVSWNRLNEYSRTFRGVKIRLGLF